MILSNAPEKINRYNQVCVHYNLVANGVYKARASMNDLFGTDYLPYIVAALISFDLGRMMGEGISRYDLHAGGFAFKLHNKLLAIKPIISHLININLCDVNIAEKKSNIITAYERLALSGEGCLNQKGHEFPVGATKILHFINPELFLIIDSNSAVAFRDFHGINYRNSTQPGYTGEKYVRCLEYAKKDIITFGVKEFCSL
jgi:hypothetical protein